MKHYVYAYLRKDGTPYYIGKGSGNRAYVKHHGNIHLPPKNRIIILEHNLSEIGALAIERRMIRWWGRKDVGTGVLINRTDGGEGTVGRIFSEEHRRKISLKNKERGCPFNVGRKHSVETNHKKSVALKGRPSPHRGVEHEQWKIDKAVAGKAKGYELTLPTGESIIVHNLVAYCAAHSLQRGNLSTLMRTGAYYKGYGIKCLGKSGRPELYLQAAATAGIVPAPEWFVPSKSA